MKVNLALSGGAARGIAHIGVIKAFEELGFEVSAISGVSAGALVGAFYCSGYTPEEMLRVVKSKDWLKYLRPTVPRFGLISLKGAEKYLKSMLSVDSFEELSKKLFVGAVDIKSGRTFYFDSGSLFPPLLGSCALPGIFEPVRYKNYVLIDGGITNNLPVEPLLGMEGLLVGVDVNPNMPVEKVGNIFQILVRSFLLSVRSNVDKRKELCHLIIEPELYGYSPLSLFRAEDIYKLGYKKTMSLMKSYARQ
ncbi:MAG: patatin-like phospholipase family protein [Aquificaceae bacterium]|nr:patatin-like phospholipase family protein [Aquificaceae bacterium]